MGGLNARRTSRSFVRSLFPLSTVEERSVDGEARYVVVAEGVDLSPHGVAWAATRREAWAQARAAVVREAERLGIGLGSR